MPGFSKSPDADPTFFAAYAKKGPRFASTVALFHGEADIVIARPQAVAIHRRASGDVDCRAALAMTVLLRHLKERSYAVIA